MRKCLCAIVMSLSFMLLAKSANACYIMAGLVLEDIQYADVVVIGRIVDYEIASLTSEKTRFLSDYARFKVLVDEVLVGQPPIVISVTWDNSTFVEPETMEEGPYLIALRKSGSKRPPLRGPSATILPSPEPNSLTVLQAPCAQAFIFEATSVEAKTIRKMLGKPAKTE